MSDFEFKTEAPTLVFDAEMPAEKDLPAAGTKAEMTEEINLSPEEQANRKKSYHGKIDYRKWFSWEQSAYAEQLKL